MHMHEYSKTYVDGHIDIEIVLYYVKCVSMLSVVWQLGVALDSVRALYARTSTSAYS